MTMHVQTQIAANGACRVGSQQFLAIDSYLFPYFFVSGLFTFYCTIGLHLIVLKLET